MNADRHWSLDKRVNLSHIIGTILIATSVFMWANKMENRISVLESQVVAQQAVDARQDRAIKESLDVLRTDLRAIQTRLDKLIEQRTFSNGN